MKFRGILFRLLPRFGMVAIVGLAAGCADGADMAEDRVDGGAARDGSVRDASSRDSGGEPRETDGGGVDPRDGGRDAGVEPRADDGGTDDSGTDDGGTDDGGPELDCSEIPQAGTRDTSSCCAPTSDRYGTKSPWTHFSDFFDGPFPDYEHGVLFEVENDHFLAIELQAPPADPDAPERERAGYIAAVTDSHAVNALHTIAYSRCPGDFSEALPEGKCVAYSANHQFWWSTYGEYYDTTCELEPGETYYINIKYATGDDLDDVTCDSDDHRCGALFHLVP